MYGLNIIKITDIIEKPNRNSFNSYDRNFLHFGDLCVTLIVPKFI